MPNEKQQPTTTPISLAPEPPPEVITVGPYTYRVQIEDAAQFRDDGTDLIGQANYLDLTMRLAGRNAPAIVFTGRWHETLHALDDLMGLGLKERQVTALAHGLVMLLRDNPHLRHMEDWS